MKHALIMPALIKSTPIYDWLSNITLLLPQGITNPQYFNFIVALILLNASEMFLNQINKSSVFILFASLTIAVQVTPHLMLFPQNNKTSINLNNLALASTTENLPSLCFEDFDEEKWNHEFKIKFNGKPLNGSTADEEMLRFFLLRFAKPGGYKKDGHFFTILSRLFSDQNLFKKLNVELSFALQQIALEHEDLGQQFNKYTITDLPKKPISDEYSCRSENEKNITREKSYTFTLKMISSLNHEQSLKKIPTLIQVMIPSLLSLDKVKIKEIATPLYRGLAQYFSEQFRGVSISKSTLFTKKYVFDKFMLPTKGELIESSILYASQTRSIILSSSPFRSETSSGQRGYLNGIYYSVHAIQESQIDWSTDLNTYQLQINKTIIDETFATNDSQPDYQALWSDKKLVGLVVISSNFDERAPEHASKYVSYFRDQGFQLKPVELINDTKKWFGEKISSGEIDYIIKEAHNGGNDRSLFGNSKKTQMVVGTKKIDNNQIEVIYILIPVQDSRDLGQSYLHEDMKSWMQQRVQNKSGPLIYINSSCYSMDQARNEVPIIQNKQYITIASPRITTTFSNTPKSTKYHILHGVRLGWSYDKMKEGMKNTNRYKIHQNRFLFPDDPEYQRLLGGKATHYSLFIYKNGSQEIYFNDLEEE